MSNMNLKSQKPPPQTGSTKGTDSVNQVKNLPRFITLEGIDGAGKSTHLESLAGFLRAHGESVLVSREPGGSELAERIRELLLHLDMGSLTELLLVFAARNDHLERLIRPALADGLWVICDRFTDATWAYQGAGRGMDASTIAWLEAQVHADLQPIRTYWFDLEPLEAAKRRAANRAVSDRFEAEDVEFFKRVRDGYEARAALKAATYLRVDAQQAPTAISQFLLSDLALLKDRFSAGVDTGSDG
jgi:dTMP kinase